MDRGHDLIIEASTLNNGLSSENSRKLKGAILRMMAARGKERIVMMMLKDKETPVNFAVNRSTALHASAKSGSDKVVARLLRELKIAGHIYTYYTTSFSVPLLQAAGDIYASRATSAHAEHFALPALRSRRRALGDDPRYGARDTRRLSSSRRNEDSLVLGATRWRVSAGLRNASSDHRNSRHRRAGCRHRPFSCNRLRDVLGKSLNDPVTFGKRCATFEDELA